MGSLLAETPVNPPTICTHNTFMDTDTHTHTKISSLLKIPVRFINIKTDRHTLRHPEEFTVRTPHCSN